MPHEKGVSSFDGFDSDFESSIKQIFQKLDKISENIPNGEINLIKDKFELLAQNQNELKDDIRRIKKILLDPEEGLIVKLNKAIELSEKQENFKSNTLITKIQTISELESFKDNVIKILWILFATMAGIILNLIFKK